MNTTQLLSTPEIERFRLNEEAVTHLGDLLNDNVLKKAISLVQAAAVPKTLPDTQPGVHPDTSVAHHFHMLIGVQTGLNMLLRMAVSAKKDLLDSPERDEFEDYAHDFMEEVKLPPEKK